MKSKKIIALLLAVVMAAALLCACGAKIDSRFVGIWEADTCESMGLTLGVKDIYPNGFSLEVKDTGYVTLHIDGDDSTGKWKEIDGGFRIDDDDELTFLENADGSVYIEMSGMTMTFVKQG